MAKQWEEKEPTHRLNLDCGLALNTKKGAKFTKLYRDLIPLLGIDNTRFLCFIFDYENYLRSNKRLRKSIVNNWFFYSRKQFADKYGLSQYMQRDSIKELTILGILKEDEKKGCQQRVWIQINNVACFVWGLIASNDEIDDEFKRKISETILDDEELQAKVQRKLKRMQRKYQNIRTTKRADNENSEMNGLLKKCDKFYGYLLGYIQ